MSLDRGRAPWISAVNYGGRLRDTTVGLVSLLSDVRFKTFSLGVDPPALEAGLREAEILVVAHVDGRDLRARAPRLRWIQSTSAPPWPGGSVSHPRGHKGPVS